MSIPDVPHPPRRAHYAALAMFFVAFAVYGSWVPFEPNSLSLADAWQYLKSAPLISFGHIDRSDWATNVLLFVPISFCLLGACCVDRPRTLRSLLPIVGIIAGCFALSICLEVVQLWLPPRCFSANDIFAQVVGTIGGIGLWLVAGQTITQWLRSYAAPSGTRRQIRWLLQAYLAGLIFYALLPLDLTIHPEELYEKLVSNRLVLIPFSQTKWNWTSLGELFTDALVFVPVGALAAIAWLPPGRTLRPLPESIFVGGVIVLAVEISQLPVMSRFTDATDVVTGTLGVAVGAYLMHRVTPHEQTTIRTGLQNWHWLLIVGVYSVIVVAYFWLPFEWIEERRLVRERFHQLLRVPGASLLSVSQFRALTEILQKILMLVPLGIFLARSVYVHAASRRTRWLRWAACLAYAALLSVVIEVGQVLNLQHTPDLSDALICLIGAAIGLFITARLLQHRDHVADDTDP